ncbi:TetR/AcrR family transcriptional regulator [Actinospica sp.]|uniref:TetR/AcrR family transcriptional regulator n=1 Tax=Actinospica sp. TaxID=1872142 RepID=UPI002CCA3D5D|nr:TetR/AcrR family transcriptional regulator C-terminal domain-containing protein [Actinospica sp.]HWG28452.1 TetR/AcrR family transcriptional regulator C-terminal domain-containing protein [Actinospica sp.]
MARPRAPLLSRQKIVTTALALIDAEGLSALTTRRLAGLLGVSGPSLYNHFATMDDLVEAVAEAVIGKVDLDGLADADLPWDESMRHWARSYRDVLAAHPNLVPVAVHGPGRRPSALRLADAVYGATVRAGWPPREATEIGALMRFFVAGAALGSFAGGFSEDPDLYGADYPHLRRAHLLASRSRDIDDAAFELGLDSLLAGLLRRRPEGG